MLTRKQARLLRALNFSMTYAGMGVTAGGALAGAAISQIKYNADKKKRERMGLDTSDMSRAKYALGGAALGGAAGFGTQHALKTDADSFVEKGKKIALANNEKNLLIGHNERRGTLVGSFNKDKDDFEGGYFYNPFGIKNGKNWKVKQLFKHPSGTSVLN